jgi:hypothetical protein
MLGCGNHAGRDVVATAAKRDDMIEVRLTNNTMTDILVISPNRPNREMDDQGCKLLLSTKVQEWIAPYAFTPELVQIDAGKSRTFLLEFSESRSAKCREVKIDVEYAYLHAKEARAAKLRDEPNFRQYVLSHQKIAHTTTSSP